jgi:serine/threonine protein phosphatase PrpC
MGEYFFGITDKGKRRDKNEDTFILMEAAGKEFLIACVIDGVGGYTGGDH